VIKLDPSDPVSALIDALERKYKLAPPESQRSPLEEFIFSFLLWESSTNRAEYALKRLIDAMADLNELRVTNPTTIAAILGKTYPLAEERAERLTVAMDDVFRREHTIELDGILQQPKRDGRKYVESLDGITPYIAARITLCVLGGHAVPVDERTLKRLIESGVVEEDTLADRASAKLERAIKASDGLRAHTLLQAWAEDGSGAPTFAIAEPKTAAKRTGRKKTSRSKAAAKK
jgi:endonuclease III